MFDPPVELAAAQLLPAPTSPTLAAGPVARLRAASSAISIRLAGLALAYAASRPEYARALRAQASRKVTAAEAEQAVEAATRALAPIPRHLKPRITIRTAWAEGWPPTWEVREPGQLQRKAPGYICVVGLEPGAELWRLLRRACYDIVRQRSQRLRAPVRTPWMSQALEPDPLASIDGRRHP